MDKVADFQEAKNKKAENDKLNLAVINAKRIERQIQDLEKHHRFNQAIGIDAPPFDEYVVKYKEYRRKIQREITQLKGMI